MPSAASARANSQNKRPAPAAGIQQVTFIRYDDATGDQHVATWPPAREYIRHGTSATSVGDPEPVSNILVPG